MVNASSPSPGTTAEAGNCSFADWKPRRASLAVSLRWTSTLMTATPCPRGATYRQVAMRGGWFASLGRSAGPTAAPRACEASALVTSAQGSSPADETCGAGCAAVDEALLAGSPPPDPPHAGRKQHRLRRCDRNPPSTPERFVTSDICGVILKAPPGERVQDTNPSPLRPSALSKRVHPPHPDRCLVQPRKNGSPHWTISATVPIGLRPPKRNENWRGHRIVATGAARSN